VQTNRGAPTPPIAFGAGEVRSHLKTPRAEVRDEKRFRALVKAAFGLRRKTLWNALKDFAGGREALRKSGIDPQRRAETLSVEEFASVERAI